MRMSQDVCPLVSAEDRARLKKSCRVCEKIVLAPEFAVPVLPLPHCQQ